MGKIRILLGPRDTRLEETHLRKKKPRYHGRNRDERGVRGVNRGEPRTQGDWLPNP